MFGPYKTEYTIFGFVNSPLFDELLRTLVYSVNNALVDILIIVVRDVNKRDPQVSLKNNIPAFFLF